MKLKAPGPTWVRLPQITTPRPPGRPGIRTVMAFSLIELLCVIAIIGILLALLLPVISRAYVKVRGMSEEVEGPAIISQVAHETRSYCLSHTQFLFQTRSELIKQVGFAPKAHDWVDASTTEFVPFGYLDDTNKVILTFHFGRKHAMVQSLTKGEVTHPPRD